MKPYTIRLQGGQMLRALHLRQVIKRYIPSHAQILDAGCDTGRDAIYLATKYPNSQIIGIDISTQAINEARERLSRTKLINVIFQTLNLLDINYSEQFDVIYSIEVLEHIDDVEKCLTNFHKALKSDGKLIIHIPSPDQQRHFRRFKKNVYPDHVHTGFKADELIKVLQNHSFGILDVRYTSGWFGSLAWEIFEIFRPYGLLKRILFPIILTFDVVDTLVTNKRGNNVMITAQKLD
jgi:2-polyprenyl-3-methyl-5-hydroxy-6-metoxy-1,4-benzoquinol methylase